MYPNNDLLSGFPTTSNDKLLGDHHAVLPAKKYVLVEKATNILPDDQQDVLPKDLCDLLPNYQNNALPGDRNDILPDDHNDTLPENDANVQHNDNYVTFTIFNATSLSSEPKQVISKCKNKDIVFYSRSSR